MNYSNRMQDRGTKKWTTMMLPEHKEQLHAMWDQERHQTRPDFDEQQLEEFSETIVHAYREELSVQVTYCSSKIYTEQNVRKISGVITDIHLGLQTIKIEHTHIYVQDLLDIQITHSSP